MAEATVGFRKRLEHEGELMLPGLYTAIVELSPHFLLQVHSALSAKVSSRYYCGAEPVLFLTPEPICLVRRLNMGSVGDPVPHRDFPERDVILVGGGKHQELEV